MFVDVEKMLPDEILKMISLLTDELSKKEKSKGIIDLEIHKEKGEICCPNCYSKNIKKNGKYKDRQLYKCKDCGKKFNSLTATPFHHTRLNYKQIETAYQCLVDKIPLRKAAEKIGVSLYTAFVLRFKLISCLKLNKGATLSRNVELDEYYVSINLKGTKKDKMPRASKKRKKHGTGKQGINHHQVCITSGVDDSDNVFFEVAGTSSVSSDMIKDTIAKYIPKGSKVITDCKSSYESVSKENNWCLKQVKSKGYVDNEGNNLATINSLHSELEYFLSGFRGVSTKYLPEYLDWFVYMKYLNYSKEYIEQTNTYKKDTIVLNTTIKYSNVFDNYSNINFNEVYADYNYQPPKCKT